jgi:hypothetical protein
MKEWRRVFDWLSFARGLKLYRTLFYGLSQSLVRHQNVPFHQFQWTRSVGQAVIQVVGQADLFQLPLRSLQTGTDKSVFQNMLFDEGLAIRPPLYLPLQEVLHPQPLQLFAALVKFGRRFGSCGHETRRRRLRM